MESLFVSLTLGVIIPAYIKSAVNLGFIIRDVTKEALFKCRNKKVKLDFEIDSDNSLIKNLNLNNYPRNSSLKYEIDGILYKEIIHRKYSNPDEFYLRCYRSTTNDDVNNWTLYMENGKEYKFNSLSYVFV